jgi:peroxiredoxin
MLNRNDIAPNFSLSDTDGKTLSLNEILRSGNNVLLVFLRHLG